MFDLIDTLFERNNLTNEGFKKIIDCENNSIQEEYLFKQADKKRRQVYGNDIYIRGLIEISNYCKNNCFYNFCNPSTYIFFYLFRIKETER